MPHAMLETDAAVTLEPEAPATACVIWMHGLGADGYDFVPIVPELRLPATPPVRFIFPHAPVRPVTLNNGYEMRAWYDIVSLTPAGREAADGLDASVARIAALVAGEQARGLEPGRIVLAGFSQGGAVALHAGLLSPVRLGGLIALSTYLPRAAAVLARQTPASRALPVLMCHGRYDEIVGLAMGTAALDALQRAGHPVEWHEYPMAHEVSVAELTAISAWLRSRLAG